MEGDAYEISPRSGRLRRRIKYKKKKPKKSLTKRLLQIIKHPVFIFSIVAIVGLLLYLSLEDAAKNDSRRKPTKKGENINTKIKEEGTIEEESKK
jgi:hypothetical protein